MKILTEIQKILLLLFWSLLIFGFNTPHIAILSILSAVIHEVGHIAVSIPYYKKRSDIPRASVFGLKIKIFSMSYKEELITALGGPVANLSVALLLVFFKGNDYLITFSMLNLMNAISNLLPIKDFDGYNALQAIVSIKLSEPFIAIKILNAVSFALCVLMCFISLFFILKTGEGYWIFTVFFSILLQNINARQKQTFYE